MSREETLKTLRYDLDIALEGLDDKDGYANHLCERIDHLEERLILAQKGLSLMQKQIDEVVKLLAL